MNNRNRFFKSRTILRNQSAFLSRLAILLNEGYSFYDAIYLLLPHHMEEYDAMLIEIDSDFRDGLSVSNILSRLGFSPSTLLPIAIAEKNGSIPEAFSGLAKRLDKSEGAKRKLRSLMAYPTVLFIFITLLLVAFRKLFLPNMESLALSRVNDQTGFMSKLPSLVTKIPDFIFALGISGMMITVGSLIIYRKLTPAYKIRFFLSIPIVRSFFAMSKTRFFANELGSLLQSGFSMQDALDILIEQELDAVLSKISADVKEQAIYGEPFYMAVSMTDGLTKQFASFAEHGENSGHLPKELLLYSEHLDDVINRRLEKGLAVLQPLLFSLIAVCILAAYIALLLPVYGMLDNI